LTGIVLTFLSFAFRFLSFAFRSPGGTIIRAEEWHIRADIEWQVGNLRGKWQYKLIHSYVTKSLFAGQPRMRGASGFANDLNPAPIQGFGSIKTRANKQAQPPEADFVASQNEV
jgi:hypothetical protein